jgi:hypothetical protein
MNSHRAEPPGILYVVEKGVHAVTGNINGSEFISLPAGVRLINIEEENCGQVFRGCA